MHEVQIYHMRDFDLNQTWHVLPSSGKMATQADKRYHKNKEIPDVWVLFSCVYVCIKKPK